MAVPPPLRRRVPRRQPAAVPSAERWLGDRPDLCVVGDPDQAIYGWNGADVSALADFGGRYPGSTIVRLETNYRSTPQIVRTASRVLARRSRRTVQGDGPIPSISVHPTDVAEAAAVARRIRDRRGPTMGWRHLAVLARTNAQLTLIEEALRAAQVPCRMRGGGSLLEQPEVKAVAARPAIAGRHRSLPASPTSRRCSTRPMTTAPGHDPASGLTDERRRNLEELVRVGHEYLALDPTGTSVGFAEWLSATLRTDDISPDADAVDLVTFHRAKGLEWPVVVVTGLERGLVPIGQATTPEALDEETRLLDVALTRAERELYLTWAEQRTFGTRQMNRSPSPLLAPIEDECEAMRQGSPETDHRASLRDARRTLDAARSGKRDGHDPLFLALKEWRLARARAAETPTYTIFDDKTLTAIVENEPRTKTTPTGGAGHRPGEARTLRRRGARARVGVRLVTIDLTAHRLELREVDRDEERLAFGADHLAVEERALCVDLAAVDACDSRDELQVGVQGGGTAVLDREDAGHARCARDATASCRAPRRTRRRCGRRGRTRGDPRRRPPSGPAAHLVVAHLHLHRRCEWVCPAEHRRVVEEAERVPRVGGLGPAVDDPTPRLRAEHGRQRLGEVGRLGDVGVGRSV